MPRGLEFSEIEKGQIVALRREGKSYGNIAELLGRTKAGIQSFVNRLSSDGQLLPKCRRSGRKKKLSPRQERLIARAASNSMKSSAQIKNECQLDVSTSTIRRSIQRTPHLRREKMMSAPRLLPRHKHQRLDFGAKNMNRDWKQVIFVLFYITFKYF